MKVDIRRVYDPPASDEGLRVFVDRLWPRGLAKDALQYDLWAKELAPSPDLRKWFGHAPQRWAGFQEKYAQELALPAVKERMASIAKEAGQRKITLLYAARDTEHNHALILAEAFRKL